MPQPLHLPHDFSIHAAPGHLIRRAQQLAVSQFNQACAMHDLTPVQFGLLTTIAQESGIDQLRLSQRMALDAATVGSVIKRLEDKGLLHRQVDTSDKRCKVLYVSETGTRLLEKVSPLAKQAQKSILSPLSAQEQADFMLLLAKLVAGLEAQSPSQ